MIVYHITPVRNYPSILKDGLSLRYCESELWPRLWFCSANAVRRMLDHVSLWHDVPLEELMILSADIDRLDLNKQGCGNYWTAAPIGARNIKADYTVATFVKHHGIHQINKSK